VVRRIGVALLLVGACALPAAAPVAARDAASLAPAVNSAQFVDPTGDAIGGGPDITRVLLENDDAGNLRFSVTTPSHSSLPSLKGIGLWFDSDRNASTGAGGTDYRVFIDPSSQTPSFDRWNASTGQWNGVSGVLTSSGYSGGVWSVSLRTSGLGGASTFNFYVGSINQMPDGTRPYADVAPNSGWWTYEIRIGQPQPDKRLAITGFTQTPRTPVAGESFRVSFNVQRIGYAGQWSGVLYCEAKVGGRRLRAFGSPQRGRAACQWDIPASAGGKPLTGLVQVTEGDAAPARRTFRARVVAPKVRLSLPPSPVTTVPAQPTAGTQFFYALNVVVRRGTGPAVPIQKGQVVCRATADGQTLKVFTRRVRQGDGDALCGWEVPHSASGATMRGTIVVVSLGQALTHRFVRRIR
jgi:hypothetical protein